MAREGSGMSKRQRQTSAVAWLIIGSVGRIFAAVSLSLEIGFGTALVLLWGFLPYLGLLAIAIANRIRSRKAVVGAAVAIAGSDASALKEAVFGGSSTSVVALLIQPGFALFVILPVALVVDMILSRSRPRQ